LSPADVALIERLPSLKVKELRKLAKDEGLPITYIGQRPKANLLEAIVAALRAR
jgi:hypothetical protein